MSRRLLIRLFVAIAVFVVSFQALAFAFTLPSVLPGLVGIAVRVGGILQSATIRVGSLSIGAGIAGVYHRLTSEKGVWVSPFTTADEPNPDIFTAPHVASTGLPIVVAGRAYPSVSPRIYESCNGRCPWQPDVVDEIEKVLSINGYNAKIVRPGDPLQSINSASYGHMYNYATCGSPSVPCAYLNVYVSKPGMNPVHPVSSGSVPSGVYLSTITTTPAGYPDIRAILIPLSTTVASIKCESPAIYDYGVSACITPAGSSEAMADGICRISWSPVNGCPIKSPFDPDCITPDAQISLSCGTPTTPPSVKIRDLNAPDQKETEVQRPAIPTQGTPGSLTVKERSADPASNTTTERRTDASAPPTAGSPPVIQGAGQNVLPGVGTNVGTTPLEQVAISNWPSSLNVNCMNCTPSSPVSFPDAMKIDGEVPEGTDLPETPDLEVSGFLDPIKDRFSSLTGLQFPAHTAKCPVLSIKFNAGSQFVDQSSTFMCDLLEEHRASIQMLMALAFTGLAISIVLRS